MTFENRITAIVVCKCEEPISGYATRVEIDDEGAGEFVEVTQPGRHGSGKIGIAPEEWPAIRSAIDMLVKGCRDNGKPEEKAA